MLKAARAHGSPIMVIAIRIAAITQPAAIHRPPNTIHNILSKSDRTDMRFPFSSYPASAKPRGRIARFWMWVPRTLTRAPGQVSSPATGLSGPTARISQLAHELVEPADGHCAILADV